MSLLLIYNPVCGSGSARSIVEEHVISLLERNGKTVDQVSATDYAGHAGIIVADYLRKQQTNGRVTIVLASGDGTLHEIVDHLSSHSFRNPPVKGSLPCISFVLVPCGTANALYSSFFPPRTEDDIAGIQYKLQSLIAYLDGKPTTPLSLAIAKISSPGDRDRSRVTISSVVTSTCLHASILEDSEALRKQMPGIER
jgi:diacylglycerol kinase family enzyme